MIIDGTQISREIVDALAEHVRTRTVVPRLGIVVVGDNPVIESFVRIKAKTASRIGVPLERVNLPSDVSQSELIEAISLLSERAEGIIVQLPLPTHIDTDTVLASIPPDKDIDGLNPKASHCVAPVALAVDEILKRAQISPLGKRAVIIGAGRLVGVPVARLLESLGAHNTTITLENGSLEALSDADIIVSGAGNPGLITPDLIRNGAVLIDAGTSESGGKVRGDADPLCAHKCAVFTPVPGGVGPIAVAMIFRNLLRS